MQPGADLNAKQAIVERIRQSTNILVAVSANPSVDALSAALAFTILLNKMDKHATAVFSGQTPPAIQFLEPSKTFTNSLDSLRDFIISLDKEKADRLRYKVEDDVVRIFITPYKTTLTEQDLQFSQGDFNVELILALGVEKREDLDKAITAHGRILHDATVVTVNANNQQSSLGALDWHDANASSLCEMLVSLSEAFQKPGLVDTQIATALLTGIVAATERFSNQRTSPKVMTMAAQMMAAGANQQLVANNLQMSAPKPLPQINNVASAPLPKTKNGQLDIPHDQSVRSIPKNPTAEEELAAALPTLKTPEPTLNDLKKQIEQETKSEVGPRKFVAEPPKSADGGIQMGPEPAPEPKAEPSSWRGRRLEPPALGGSLSATTEQALEDKNAAEEEQRNKKILSHFEAAPPKKEVPKLPQLPIIEPPSTPPAPVEPIPAPVQSPLPPPPVTPKAPLPAGPPASSPPIPAEPTAPPPAQSIEALEAARKAVDEALSAQPFSPAGQPTQAINAQPLPVEQPQISPQPAAASPLALNTALPPIPPMPQLPVHEPGSPTMPPMPPALPPLPSNDGQMPTPLAPPAPPPAPIDPGQFKIPGQP